eukprot:m51a1_g6140 hypothetical protein (306) ;mRNA; r:277080-277997
MAALGTCVAPYDYSRDSRELDPVAGTSCHQCRQKNVAPKTQCTRCRSVRGQLCGMCLQLRYGENLDEVRARVAAGEGWECPVCRDICNCSGTCRRAKGWPPTGILGPRVIAGGYPSVAHYLVMNHLKKADDDHDDHDHDEDGDEPAPSVPPSPSQQSQGEVAASEEKSDPPAGCSAEAAPKAQEAVAASPSLSSRRKSRADQTEKKSTTKKRAAARGTKKQRREEESDEEEEEEEEELEVERILDSRVRRGVKQYLVRWLGYASDEDTWEPEHNCVDCPDLIRQYEEEQQQQQHEGHGSKKQRTR